MPSDSLSLLVGAYDIHIHASPDVIPRAQDWFSLARDAHDAGMAGLVVKDHTSSTAGLAHALNALYATGPRLFGALVLNESVGGLNPYAVEAALREGVAIIYFPTYTSAHQIATRPDAFAPAYPRPRRDYAGIRVLDADGALHPEVVEIVDLIGAHDAVLATGHVSADEALALVRLGQRRGVRRMVVTHATAGMSVAQQREAVACGAMIEHCLQWAAPWEGAHARLRVIRDQIEVVGVEHAIVSSDFGQAANGPVVAAFARYLGALRDEGLCEDSIRTMIVDNPRRLLDGRSPQA
mgnify:CR=1 FL=1